MKTILVPTDFSKNADEALDYAIGIAKEQHAKIILLNTWEIIYPATDIPVPMEFVSEQISSLELNAFKNLKPLCAKVKSEGIECDFINKQGLLIDVIQEIIKQSHIDLIIMGTKGASGLKEFFMGSNTAKVLQKVICPVIVIPGGAIFKGLKKITYATDYQTSDFSSLKKVAELAKLFEAEITLLHISDEHYSTEGAKTILKVFSEKVREKIHYDNISVKLISGNDVEEKLDEFVKQKHADLFVMSMLSRSLFDRLFGKSYTKKMAYHTKMPLMVFHHSEHEVVFI